MGRANWANQKKCWIDHQTLATNIRYKLVYSPKKDKWIKVSQKGQKICHKGKPIFERSTIELYIALKVKPW